MISTNRVYNTDCLEGMREIDDGCIDMVLADLPYGTTKCEWDKRIPFEPLWEEYKRVTKPNAAIVLFSAQPFTTDLINSNRKMFRYEIIWRKTLPSGFLNAKKMPLRVHENVCVFYKKLPVYNPQKTMVVRSDIGRRRSNGTRTQQYNPFEKDSWTYTEDGTRYPVDVIHFSNWNGALFGNTTRAVKHPTQKPVPLLEYLIRTYTNEGDVVLDNCIGSGSTAVACLHTRRNFIGFEKDINIYQTCIRRLEEETACE